MKRVFLFALLCIAFSVNADPRIEVNANNSFCHVPFDPDNDDNESFIADCGGIVVPRNGVANGFATVIRENIPVRGVNLDIGPGQLFSEVRINGVDSDFTCTLVDSNGTEYDTQEWSVWTKVQRYSTESPMGKAIYEVFCFNAQQVN